MKIQFLIGSGWWFVMCCGTIAPNRRVDCSPKPGANQNDCLSHDCIWDNANYQDSTVPFCYFPENTGYIIDKKSKTQLTLVASSSGGKNPYGSNISPVEVEVTNYGNALNLKIGSKNRYQPPVRLPRESLDASQQLEVLFTQLSNLFSFQVRRKSTGSIIWNTSIGGLLFADQYIQIATYLPSDKMYGFGENVHSSLKHSFTNYTTWAMFARDQEPDPQNMHRNLYGVHPFYLALEADSKAHGVLFWNSNAQEVTTGPAPHLVYRTIGGMLDITFFPGPSPEQVIQQYLAFIGKPFLPAYFALGFQFCRYGYKSLDEMKTTVSRIRDSGIPLEIAYADIDYMERYKDFTIGQKYWADFEAYTQQLHKDGLRLFLIFDPAIQVDYDSFKRAIDLNASFIEWDESDEVPHNIQDQYQLVKNTMVMLGVVWPDKHVAFPDFLDPLNATTKWWIEEFKRFHEIIDFDGIWIDMNEPAVFGTNQLHPFYFDDSDRPIKIKPLMCSLNGPKSKFDNPPYETWNVYRYNYAEAHLSNKTLCMSAMTARRTQRFYDNKNLYGLAETIATSLAHQQAIGKRGAVISRSTFVSSGHYGGHWLGDNTAQWADLRVSIIGIQEFNLFGIPYIGADVCGFNGDTTEELCLRWQQLGAFYSFYRNHNAKGAASQDPARWPTVASATRQATLFRYYYLPYLYSLLFAASIHGGTVVRPVFFEFVTDPETHNLGEQFMWGDAVIVIPVTSASVDKVSGYLPYMSVWYSIRESDYGMLAKSGHNIFAAPKTDLIPVFARGGSIIPRQKPNMTTSASRRNPFELLITMSYDKSEQAQSNGTLYWDDGESIVDNFVTYAYSNWYFEFVSTCQYSTLYVTPMHITGDVDVPSLDVLDILGYSYKPNLSKAQLNGHPIHINPHTSFHDSIKNRLYIKSNNFLNISKNQKLTLTWPHAHLDACYVSRASEYYI